MTDISSTHRRDNNEREHKNPTTFRERVAATRTKRWIRFGIVSVIFFIWATLVGNPWVFLLWFLLFDIYITGYIPLTWWKKSKSATVRTVMGWVDAILYALVLVYFIFAFVGQNYKIPSSSLEKSLLVGDYLWTNKMVYGARVPQTPLHFPLAQHTLPVTNSKSYFDRPQIAYHRLPGLRGIERGDIVVFNYPCGDTVALQIQNPDYYQIVNSLRHEGIDNPKEYIAAHEETFGKVVWRPVDRRENYVKRAIGLPGERLKIVNDTIYINGEIVPEPENVQYNYVIPVSSPIAAEQWQEIDVRREDAGIAPVVAEGVPFSFYSVPLTAKALEEVKKWPQVNGPIQRESAIFNVGSEEMFPLGNHYGWTRPNIGELWIPKRGVTLKLTSENLPIYRRAITVYEGNELTIDRDGTIRINGKETQYYTFKMDYYWMMGDNRDRSADSRYWGFVPEDHIVGTPMFVICSFDEERGWFDGKIRWNRILRNANPERGKFTTEK